jgi:hypothetical protein
MDPHFAKLFAKAEFKFGERFTKSWKYERKIEPGNPDERSIVGLN